MKVILLRDIVKLGRKGEIMEVTEGYAHNYLIKLGYAKIATPKVQEQFVKQLKTQAERQAREMKELEQLRDDLAKRSFTLKVKVGDKGQVFGAVHEKDIAQVINSKLKTKFDKNQIALSHGLKTLGEHAITIKLGSGIIAKTKLILESL